jgi:RNA polymerase sigma-70 factor, ECF subfamily
MTTSPAISATPPGSDDFQSQTEPFRRELLAYCYRFLGSLDDAEDALQEALLRAWRRLDSLHEPHALRAWLYRISANVCLDMLASRKRRGLPNTFSAPGDPQASPGRPVLEPVWLTPLPDDYLETQDPGPEARYDARESVALAFLAVLQTLPGRQRAVLILRDVLGMSAQEVAGLLEISPAAANSALQRARATLKQHPELARHAASPAPGSPQTAALLERYMRAWETADAASLLTLLRQDAVLTMPPLPGWYQGRPAVVAFLSTYLFSQGPAWRFRLQVTRANGGSALAVYERDPSGIYRASTLQLLQIEEDQVTRVDCFLDPEGHLFTQFKLPVTLPK